MRKGLLKNTKVRVRKKRTEEMVVRIEGRKGGRAGGLKRHRGMRKAEKKNRRKVRSS